MNLTRELSSAPPAADACWRRIGVWGDQSCPELEAHVHCSNCPVFAAAGRGLLDRPAPENYLAEWSEVLAGGGERREPMIAALLFRLGPAWLALPAAAVASISETRTPHRVPHRYGKIFTGLVNLAGELQLAFDLHALFGLPAAAPPEVALSRRVYPRCILFRHGPGAFAFGADEVYGAAAFAASALAPVAAAGAALAVYARGRFDFQGRAVWLLDDELLASALNRLHLA